MAAKTGREGRPTIAGRHRRMCRAGPAGLRSYTAALAQPLGRRPVGEDSVPLPREASPIVSNHLVVIPAFNEEANVASVVADVRASLPGFDVLVIDDGSSDETVAVARHAGARVLRLP